MQYLFDVILISDKKVSFAWKGAYKVTLLITRFPGTYSKSSSVPSDVLPVIVEPEMVYHSGSIDEEVVLADITKGCLAVLKIKVFFIISRGTANHCIGSRIVI